MKQKRRTLYKEFIIMLCVFAMLTGCGKEETAEVRAAAFSEADQMEEPMDYEKESASGSEGAGESTKDSEKSVEEKKSVWVYVCGQVFHPGVYELPAGGRIVDALNAAGGMTEQAADIYLNQAKVLEDGQKVYVPSQKEAENHSVPIEGGETEDSGTGGSREAGRTDKINLNTAGKAELMGLSGIGESRAEAIISYRDANGGFKRIEEIKKIEGIKEGIFNKIKDKITV